MMWKGGEESWLYHSLVFCGWNKRGRVMSHLRGSQRPTRSQSRMIEF